MLALSWVLGGALCAATAQEAAVDPPPAEAPIVDLPAAGTPAQTGIPESPAAPDDFPPAADAAPVEDPTASPAGSIDPLPIDPLPADPAPPVGAPPAPLEDPAEEIVELEDPTENAVGEQPGEAAPIDWGGLIERAPEFLAVTHHAAVHLPIALWLFGAFFVIVGWVFPSWRNQIPVACLVGGAITSISAVLSGWWYAEFEYGDVWSDYEFNDLFTEHIVKHRWVGVALMLASLLLSIIAIVSQRKQSFTLGFVWRAGLIGLALGVAWEGHLGGELIQGEGFFEEALEAWIHPEAE